MSVIKMGRESQFPKKAYKVYKKKRKQAVRTPPQFSPMKSCYSIHIWLSKRDPKINCSCLIHLPASTPAEVGVDINVVSEGLLATPLGTCTNRDVKGGLSWCELLGEETAVGCETVALLLEVRCLELDATTGAEAEEGHPRRDNSILAVGCVLRDGICF
jgi:hypothetical protein